MYWNISLTANEKSLLDDLLFHALFVKISKSKPGVFVHTNHAPVNRLLEEGKRMREDYRERFRILGLRIAYYRKMRGMTQEQVTAKLQLGGCDITRSALAKIEVGQRHVYPDEIKLLKEILSISYDDLFDSN